MPGWPLRRTWSLSGLELQSRVWVALQRCKDEHRTERNFIQFSWPYIMKYLSDLDEKLMVTEVKICSFRGVLRKNDGLVVKGLSLKFKVLY